MVFSLILGTLWDLFFHQKARKTEFRDDSKRASKKGPKNIYDFCMVGTLQNEPPCRREHDFKVLSKSRKVLHFGVVLVPPFAPFGVS